MTQTPNNGRVRRTERYASRPEDMTPAPTKKAPQPKQAIGRSAELQARMQQQEERAAQPAQRTRASQPSRTVQSARRPVNTYSDFDAEIVSARRSYGSGQRRRPGQKHTLLWFTVAMICLICSGALVVFLAPQLLNLDLGDVSNFAFVNGSVIMKDQNLIDSFEASRAMLQTNRIHQGVYIDGVHVGGMTPEEAVAAVNAVPSSQGSAFDIGVEVDGYRWSINSDVVPMYRNTAEVVQQAWALGRGNTMSIRGTAATPLRQRLNSVQDLMEQPVGLWTKTTYDHGVVRDIVEGIAASVNRAPVNASVDTFDPSTRRFTFHADESGVYVDADAIYREVVARLDSGATGGTLYVTPEILLAEITRSELMNSFGRISTFTTKKTGNTNRTTNIALSAEALNGSIVQPGETFSFNRATGQRTEAKGYKPAAAIAGGETFDEIGGGVCQTSSTLFNAVVRANLTIVSRKPHAWPSDYVPKGEDATVNWPDLDFKFRNDTGWPIFIVASCDKSNKTVTVDIYGKSLGEGASIDLYSEVVYTKNPPDATLYVYNPDLPYGTEKQTVKPRTGYKVQTYKVYYQNGQEVGRELLHTSEYRMYQRTVQHNKPNQYGMSQ